MNQIPTAQKPSPENLLSFLPGEKRALALPPFSLPLTIVHGMHPGKKLLLTAGVHGCEYCSIVAAMELCRELDPKELSGSVVIAPIANMSGFYERLAALVAEDGTIGIRITREEFTVSLLHRFNRPLVSTSANISGMPSPRFYAEVSDEIRNAVDYIVDYRRNDHQPVAPSSILKIGMKGEIEIIRK